MGQSSLQSLLLAKEQVDQVAVLVDAELAGHELHDTLQQGRSVPQHWSEDVIWYHESSDAYLGANKPVRVGVYLGFPLGLVSFTCGDS